MINSSVKKFYWLALLCLCCLSFFTCFVYLPDLAEKNRVSKQMALIALAAIPSMLLICYQVYDWSVNSFTKHNVKGIAIGLGLVFFYYGLIRLGDFRFWMDEKVYWYVAAFCFFIAYSIMAIRKPTSVRWMVFALALSAGAQAVIALLQLYSVIPSYHKGYITGTFFNPALLGGYLSAIVPFTLAFAGNMRLPNSSNKRKYFLTSVYFTIISVLCLVVLPATYSRAAWMAALSGVSLFFLTKRANQFHIRKTLKQYRINTIWLTVIVILLVGALAWGVYNFKKDSADGRLLTWNVCIEMIKSEPVFGIGFNNFEADYLAYQSDYFAQGKGSEAEGKLAGNIYWAFNEFLQITVELGVIGIVLFLAWLLSTIVPVIKQKKLSRIERAALSSLLALLVFSCFSYPFYSPPLYLIFLLNMAILASSVKYTINLSSKLWQVTVQMGVFVLLLLCCVNAYFLPSKYDAYWHWDEAKHLYRAKEYKLANDSYAYAYSLLQTNGKFLLDYGENLIASQDYKLALSTLKQAEKHRSNDEVYNAIASTYQALKDYANAEAYYIKSSCTVPHKFYPIYSLAKLYLASGDTLSARQKASEIINKPIKIPSQQIEQMKEEMLELLYINTYRTDGKE